MSRRALMLVSQDPVIEGICHAMEARREAHNRRVEDLQKQVERWAEEVRRAEGVDTERLDQRVKDLKITVFDSKNHKVVYDYRQGVVWVESTTHRGCGCPICRLFGG